VIDLRVRVADKSGQSKQKLVIRVDGTTEIERPLKSIERPGLDLDFMGRLGSRTFADEIVDSARSGLTIKYR
jgi:hypothetical protein